WRTETKAQQLLRDIAGDAKENPTAKLDAVLGLAHSAPTDVATRTLLLDLAGSSWFKADALRSLRSALKPADAKFFGPWWDNLNVGDDKDDMAEHVLMALGQPFTGN